MSGLILGFATGLLTGVALTCWVASHALDGMAKEADEELKFGEKVMNHGMTLVRFSVKKGVA